MPKPRRPLTVATEDGENWRGRLVQFMFKGMLRQGKVITHLRNDIWLVDMDGERIRLGKSEFWPPPRKEAD